MYASSTDLDMFIFILNASLALYVSFGYFYIYYSVFQNKKGYLFIYGGAQYACGGQNLQGSFFPSFGWVLGLT